MKKITVIFLITSFMVEFCFFGRIYADTNPAQPAPEKLRVEAIHNTPPFDVQPPIGYNEFDGYYADIMWDALANPDPNVAGNKYINFYLQSVNKPYRPPQPVTLKEGNISGNAGAATHLRMKNLKSGTVYYTYARAYYTYTDGMITYTSPESVESNTVKFMTDIEVEAYSYGTKQIRIVWDDVWNSGRRIDYKLYISESKDFSNTPPIYINQQYIGPNGPVKVIEADGKLEYVHTVRDPGRVYYIKIAPDIAEAGLKHSPESRTLSVSSFIMVKTTKMFATDFGIIWRLDWSPVVTGLGDSSIKISYHIYKGKTDGSIPQYMASVDDTTFFVTLEPGEENSYFIIRALVKRDGEDVYPGIKIESDKIYMKESEVPSYPPVPELVDEFTIAGTTIISYEEELTSNEAAILWRAPRKGNGDIDTETTYDIWLLSDPSLIDNPPDVYKIASSVKMGDSNRVMSGTTVLGYKYEISGLIPNSTYYFKMVARKDYIEYVDDALESVVYTSQPALKVIITPPDGPIDQPLIPGRPPLSLKKSPPPDSKEMITETTALIQIKNKWYEEYNAVLARWEYRTIEDLGSIVDDIEDGTANPLEYRKVEYDSGVTIDVGCVEYRDGMVYSDLESIPADRIVGFPTAPNDPYEDPALNPDGKKHNVDIEITGLNPNSSYIVWVRAARRSVNKISGPSDPIIITTNPVMDPGLEKPTVPVFNYSYASDVFIDLGWDFRTRYVYYIKYGTSDNIASASGNLTVKPEDLLYVNFYRVRDLKPDTLYYFWIQAESTGKSGQTSMSEWSDSNPIKTLPNIPPSTPKGFGVKNIKGAAAKNSITYEWLVEEGMEYILEIDTDIDYKDAVEYSVGSDSEITVSGLRSNFRYFARLYAYDRVKDLRSAPTQSVVVRTHRSDDDYDSDEDIESIASGDYIIKDRIAVDKTWNIRITGVNADRLIERVRTDRMLDYKIDLTNPPKGAERIVILMSGRFFDELTSLKENLIIVNPDNRLIIRPGMLSQDTGGYFTANTGEFNYEIEIGLDVDSSKLKKENLSPKTPVTNIDVRICDGINRMRLKTFNRPLKAMYEYTQEDWYKESVTSGYVSMDGLVSWKKSDTTAVFSIDANTGYISFETLMPGLMTVAEPEGYYYDDIINHWARDSIMNVASIYELKSVTGRKFEPGRFVSRGEAVKFMFDVLDYRYGYDYMVSAVKAGIISVGDVINQYETCTREEIIMMAVRVYELKSGEKASPPADFSSGFDDIDDISQKAFPAVSFAIDNGLVVSRFEKTLGPKDPLSRAEVIVLLEKVLALVGEVD